MTVQEILEKVHKDTSPAMGQLCIALERRNIRREQLISWAESLERGASRLRHLAEELRKPSK